MGKVYLYCGAYRDIPEGTTILGSLTATQAEMSAIGKGLRAPSGSEHLMVFSNSSDVAHGVRIAIRGGELAPEDFAFMFHDGDQQHQVTVGADGDMQDMLPGLFDQAEFDLIQLF
jgi:hypothetical protein